MIASQRVKRDQVGIVLEGAYRLTRLIGEGGMGAVYEAVQLRLNKRVAVKLMARELAANQEALARFRREADIASHIGHHHLVTVIDFGMADSGEPYLVMEYLQGEDLEQRLRRVVRLPVALANHIIRQTASAVGAAHSQGVVHRDLKPANVFLAAADDEPDFVKVLDFGISKMKAARTRLTRASMVFGTPNYMAPEQAAGRVEAIDHRADQWALGCIAWEMLCGRPPFVADDINALFYQILNLDPPALQSLAPELPPALEPVLLQALAKDRKHRFDSIKLFARAFERAALGRPAELTPPPPDLPAGVVPAQPLWRGESSTSYPIPPVIGETSESRGPVAGLRGWLGREIHPGPRRALRLYAIGAVAGVVLTLAAILLLRFLATGGAPHPPPTVRVAPLPTHQAPVVTPAPATPLPPDPPLPPRSARGKRHEVGRKATAAGLYGNPFGRSGDPFERTAASGRSSESPEAKTPARPHARRPNPF